LSFALLHISTLFSTGYKYYVHVQHNNVVVLASF
jgi:hypothetical protein